MQWISKISPATYALRGCRNSILYGAGLAWADVWPLLVIGFFSIRVSGVYFIMLTLAFSQMFHAYTFQVSWLGAEDGLVGIPRPTVPGVDLASLRGFHAYLLGLVVLVAVALWRIVRSPFGHVLRGIHENEARMEALGYAVDRYKLLAFVIAGIVAGVAGSLYTQFNGSITPDAFYWKTSGEALLMVIIGGTGTLGALGAAALSCSRAWSAPTPSGGC
jgi:branched-chain amino acid transport system permease protein